MCIREHPAVMNGAAVRQKARALQDRSTVSHNSWMGKNSIGKKCVSKLGGGEREKEREQPGKLQSLYAETDNAHSLFALGSRYLPLVPALLCSRVAHAALA